MKHYSAILNQYRKGRGKTGKIVWITPRKLSIIIEAKNRLDAIEKIESYLWINRDNVLEAKRWYLVKAKVRMTKDNPNHLSFDIFKRRYYNKE